VSTDDPTLPVPAPAERRLGRRGRHAAQVGSDAIAWAAGLVLAELARFDLAVPEGRWADLGVFVVVAVALAIPVGYAFGLYVGRFRYGSFEEVAALARATGVVAIALFALNLALDRPVPASVPLAGSVVAFVLCGTIRYSVRLLRERRLRPHPADRKRLLVLGAGDGGVQALSALLRQPDSPYVPVALLDDDPDKRRLRIMGVSVVGTRDDIPRAAEEHDADALLVAIPTAPATLLREVTAAAAGVGLEVRVLPRVTELFGVVTVGDIRPPTPADLMGRQEIDIDVAGIAEYLRDQRVLVTGAGGSIGSELCRQIARFDPERLVMLDRDESSLLAVQLSLDGAGRLDSPDLVVGSVRDAARMHEVFATHRPHVVFHAAALKHVPLLELNPREAYTTNVLGTHNVLEAALTSGVSRFVNVSTDKAADPANVLGYTKRLAERLTADAALRADGIYLSVRFGNVLGSRGSVLETFRAQVAAGGPITVTDADVTRYLMTREEAIVLMTQAGAVGRSGEVLVLDLGEPVRILDIAERVAAGSDRPIEIVFTGLRPGEKLRETLFGRGEVATRPFHPLISHCPVPPQDIDGLDDLSAIRDDEELRQALARRWSSDSSRSEGG
jgi:FlaA1/EpsC-like NDP-sugar epimerase